MSFDLTSLGEAIAAALGGIAGVTVYSAPPLNLNPPALVVSYPELVEFGTPALGFDTSTVSVVCVVGYADPTSAMSDLVASARAAIAVDRKLGGAVAMARATQLRTIRADRVGGIDVLTADLVLTVES